MNRSTKAPHKMLTGAKAIAAYLGCNQRQIYHWIETAGLPTFRIGRTVCGNPEKLTAWVDAHESRTAREGR